MIIYFVLFTISELLNVNSYKSVALINILSIAIDLFVVYALPPIFEYLNVKLKQEFKKRHFFYKNIIFIFRMLI